MHLVVSVYVNLYSSGFALDFQIHIYTSNLVYNLHVSRITYCYKFKNQVERTKKYYNK